LGAACDALRASGVRSLAAAVDSGGGGDGDAALRAGWDFRPLEAARLSEWGAQLPAHHRDLVRGSTMLELRLL